MCVRVLSDSEFRVPGVVHGLQALIFDMQFNLGAFFETLKSRVVIGHVTQT